MTLIRISVLTGSKKNAVTKVSDDRYEVKLKAEPAAELPKMQPVTLPEDMDYLTGQLITHR